MLVKNLCMLNKVLNHRPSCADSMTRPTASAEPMTQPSAPAARTVKLPRLTLPQFSGNILKWSSFWDSYASAAHNNPDLSDVDKFNYLRSLLEGSAYDAIAGLTLSSATYSEAISDMVISKSLSRSIWRNCWALKQWNLTRIFVVSVVYMMMWSRTSAAYMLLELPLNSMVPC